MAENYGPEEPMDNVANHHGQTNSGGGLLTFLAVSRFGHTPGAFPDSEERVRREPNQYAAGSFLYMAHRILPPLLHTVAWHPTSQPDNVDAQRQLVTSYALRGARSTACSVSCA